MSVPVSVYADPAWVQKYVGIPYATHGFTTAGVHCWGLVVLAYLQECGIALARHGELSADDVVKASRAFRRGRAQAPWQRIASLGPGEAGRALIERVVKPKLLRAFDVVSMFSPVMIGGKWVEGHVGLMIDHRKLIHTEEDCGTVKLELTDYTVGWRVAGFYRHTSLAAFQEAA